MATMFRFFEDYPLGLEGVTSSRTVGETAIDTFGYVTGDYSPEHLDRHSGTKSPYGERVAHGLLGACLAPGMISLTAPYVVGRGVRDSFLRGFAANYRKAILIGDTIQIYWRLSEKADDPRCEGFGVVTTSFQIVNQENVPVYDGTLALSVAKGSAKDARPRFESGTPWTVDAFVLDPAKSYVLEDYVVGQGEESAGRTITEADVVNFAGLTGDLNPLYVDADYAKQSAFGERIVPSMLAFSAILTLWDPGGDFRKARAHSLAGNWAGHLGDGATFLMPVKIGDTLRCRRRIESTRPSRTKPHKGVLRLGVQIVNQRDEVVQEGYVAMTAGTRLAAGQRPAI